MHLSLFLFSPLSLFLSLSSLSLSIQTEPQKSWNDASSHGGYLPNLYKSLENHNATYLQPDRSKDTYLKPVIAVAGSSVPLLSLDDAQIQRKFYRCGCNTYVSDDPHAVCPACHRHLNSGMTYVAPPVVKVAAEDGGLVKGVVTYMVMDDLVVKPMSTISSISLLNSFNVKEVGALEEKVVHLGMNEAIKLLKTSLQSKKVLTDVFF